MVDTLLKTCLSHKKSWNRRRLVRNALTLVAVFLLLPGIVGCESGNPQKLKIGDRMPAFEISDLQGNQISSKKWRGTPIILRFWDTECKYCRADTPLFNRYFDKYKERGLNVLYVATGSETPATVKQFVSDLDIIFPVAHDLDGKMADEFLVKITPQTIIISPEQKILSAILGGVSEAELEELIGGYLKE